jgi:hypothetical protein
LEGNFDLSCAQFESNDHNEFKDEFKEPPLDVHKDFIQYNHDENVAADSQMVQPVYTKPQEECLHWMNRSNGKSHHFTSKFYDVDCSSGAEFNEEDIFQASKEGNLQQEVPWVVCFIFEDNEIVGEQQKTTLQFSTNVQQQFIFATSPWKHGHCMKCPAVGASC